MARESNAPKEPLTPARPSEAPRQAVSQQPEFGVPSPLGPPQRSSSNNIFNIPKQNRARPEHHRPQQSQGQSTSQQNRPPQPVGYQQSHQSTGYQNRPHQAYRPPAAGRGRPEWNYVDAFDPIQPLRPSAYNDHRPSIPVGATPIKRPEHVTYSTPRAPRALFTSKPSKQSNPAANLQNFIDLTKEVPSAPNQNSQYGQKSSSTFGSVDAYSYIDSEKANENIKALLEGAFEEEDDNEPKPKSKKKSKKSKKTKKGKKDESAKSTSPEPATETRKVETSDLDDLAAQLQGVTVDDAQGEDEPTDKVKKQTSKAPGDGAENDKVEAEEAEEAEEDEDEDEDEEEEEEEEELVIEGLKVNLLPHQVEGVRWMCEKEIGGQSKKGMIPKGGILADDMGLGKTVQAISLILKNRKPEHSENNESTEEQDESAPPASSLSSSTLVVAPLALIKQWEAEIGDKIERSHRLRVCVYHGANRAKTAKSLDDYDVVITTYGTLTSESAAGAASGIFSVYWHRVILDEAHTIKNRNAKATQAACTLNAKFRWCLTGTPMQNNLDELQSLIKFLRIKPYDELAAWRDQITKPLNNGRGGLAIQRLQVYLKAFMKRRTKDVLKQNQKNDSDEDGDEDEDEADGKPKKSNGFKIVKREVIRVDGKFLEGEQSFYNRLEQRTENRLEEMMGGAKVDYAGALVLLLRLRQACNHPDLVKSDLVVDKDVLLQTGNTGNKSKDSKKDDLDDVADLFGGLSVVTKKCDVCQRDLSSDEAKSGASRCTDCETDLNTDFMSKEKKKKLKKAHKHHQVTTVVSPVSKPSRARKNRRVILDSDDEDEDDGEWIVPEDKRSIPNLGRAGGSDDEDAEGGGDWIGPDDSDTDDEEIDSPSGKKTRPIVLSSSEDESDSDSDEYSEEIPYQGENGELPSTKIRHLMKILHKESADYKFIVFSVFTSMLDKIEPFLNSANIGFARYDGGMRNDHREASLNKLRNNKGTRVLLCSLRAGALGLNLTAASRVVILEPFWNPFVEEQAIDRVHRLNQTIDVKIYRMVIAGTVEERIVSLQDRKRELANMTIEGKSAAGKLTMRDMMALFGRDAEAKFVDKQETLDFKKPTRLLSSTEDSLPPTSSQSSERSGSRPVDRRQQSNRSTPDDSVYGRRW